MKPGFEGLSIIESYAKAAYVARGLCASESFRYRCTCIASESAAVNSLKSIFRLYSTSRHHSLTHQLTNSLMHSSTVHMDLASPLEMSPFALCEQRISPTRNGFCFVGPAEHACFSTKRSQEAKKPRSVSRHLSIRLSSETATSHQQSPPPSSPAQNVPYPQISPLPSASPS